MKSQTAIFVFICLLGHARGQDINFCSTYNSKGEPIGASNTWNLGEKGGYVYALFSNHNKRIKSKTLILNIRKQSGSVYQNYEKRAMEIQSSKTWALLDYQFTDAGNYKVSVLDKEGKELATGNLTITLKVQGQKNQQSQTGGKDPDRDYYRAKTVFCRSVTNRVPTDTGSVFRAGQIYVSILNDRPLASDTMIVDVFKKGYETEKYPIYVLSKDFWIDGTQSNAYFSINLDQTGEYKVISYNRRSQTISEGFLKVR